MTDDHSCMDAVLNMVSDGKLTLKDITITLQAYIQKYGGLDENKPAVKRFLNTIRGEKIDNTK